MYWFIPLWAVCAGSVPEDLGRLGELTTLGLNNNKLTGEDGRAERVALGCVVGVWPKSLLVAYLIQAIKHRAPRWVR